MNHSSYELIADVLHELKIEYNNLQNRINEYLDRIKEADCYIQSFLNREDQDEKIFSPRKAEDIYRDEIAKANTEKSNIQFKLNKCYDEQNLLRSKIEKLEKVCEDEKNNDSINWKDTTINKFEILIHKIELSSMFIDQDPIRAKMEMKNISKDLKNMTDEIRDKKRQ